MEFKIVCYYQVAPGREQQHGFATKFEGESLGLVVSNKQISSPVAVRFSFSNTGMSNLFNKEGLPVIPFRTDNWEVIPVKQ